VKTTCHWPFFSWSLWHNCTDVS